MFLFVRIQSFTRLLNSKPVWLFELAGVPQALGKRGR